MKQPKVIAIIIARGGSRRLPRKNVLPFCGLPLVEWSIIQACNTHCLEPDRVYLSTDDEEIANIGMQHLIRIIWRPDWDKPDDRSGAYVFRHALNKIKQERPFDVHLNLLPTSPVRLPDDLDRIYRRYIELKALYPDCKEVDWVTPERELVVYKFLDNARMALFLWNKTYWFARQGHASHLYETENYLDHTETTMSDYDVDNTNKWAEPGKSGRVQYYLQNKWFQKFDVDDEETFELNEILMEKYILKGRGPEVYTEYGAKR